MIISASLVMDIMQGNYTSVPAEITEPSCNESVSEYESDEDVQQCEPLVGEKFLQMTLDYNSIPFKFGEHS